MKRRWLYFFIPALLGIGLGVGSWYWNVRSLPKRFAPVVEGKLYRSGLVTPTQLERLRNEYGIRRVVSLLNPDAPESIAERQAAERLGLEWHNVPLTGDGASTPADREKICGLLERPGAAPTLVHCAAGSNRTGLAVGMYRLRQQGWTLEQVMEEMKQFSFRDEPHHQNLREALASEAALGRSAATQPGNPPAGRVP